MCSRRLRRGGKPFRCTGRCATRVLVDVITSLRASMSSFLPPRALRASRADLMPATLQVLRSSLLFVWKDNNGRVWRDVIRDSARQEFDAARRVWPSTP